MSRVHPQGFRIASTSHRLVQTNQKSWCGTFSPQRFQYRLCRPPTDAEAPTMLEITELPYAKAIEAQRAPGGWVFVAVALPLHSSAKWESGPISSMCANQHSNHLFSFGVCRVNPTFQMRAFLLHLILYILLHLVASCCIMAEVEVGCFVALSLKLLLTAWGSLPAPAARGHSQCPSGHGHQYQHRGETFAAGIWHMGSLS